MSARVTDAELAASLAAAAGELLVELRASGIDPDKLGDEGDLRANDLLLERLAAERPADAVLSEESADDLARLDADRVWIIDPLDGTREFTELPRTDWAVHVGLWVEGDLAVGAVALPAQDIVLRSSAGAGAAAGTRRPAAPRGEPHPPAGHHPGRRRSPRRRARAHGLGRRQGHLGGARHVRRLRSTAAGSGSGTRPPPWPSAGPPGSTPPASTALRSSTTSRSPGCPTSSSAAPSWPMPCWRPWPQP